MWCSSWSLLRQSSRNPLNNLQVWDHAAGRALACELHKGFRRVHDVARHAARRQIEVLLQEGLMHVVQMVKGDGRRFQQRGAGDAVREVAIGKGF